MAISRDSEICRSCPNYKNCDNKRMEACATFKPPERIASEFALPSSQPITQEIAVKHDYRNIKIAENTTVTIDLEDMKKQLEKDFYKKLGCGFLMEG